MKRIKLVLATLFVAAVAPLAVAQHGGHGGASSGGGFGNAGSGSATRDLERALMLSATEEQRTAFARCMEATDRVLRITDGMAGPGTGSNHDAGAFAEQKEQLPAALAALATAHQHFRHSLSQPQEKELRKPLSKLEGFQADLRKRMAQVDRELATNQPDPRRVHGDTRKIKEVAEKWKSEHRKIAEEMGIGGVSQ